MYTGKERAAGKEREEIFLVDEPEAELIETDEDDPEREEGPFEYQEDAPNLVDRFVEHEQGRRALKLVGEKVRRDMDSAWESSEPYREKRAQEWKIFTGELPEKDFPFKDAANAHVPIMLENITRLHFRAESELFGDWSHVFNYSPVGPDDRDLASILTLHGNWQISEEIPDFKRQQSRGLLIFFLHGDVTAHSYYDHFTRQNRHEVLTCDEFVTPYVYVSTMPDYGDCPYYCRVRYYYPHELRSQMGRWYGVEDVLAKRKPSWSDDPETKLRSMAEEVELITEPDADMAAPHKVIQWEGWLELPNQDRERWCQVFMDYSTTTVFSLLILEEEDWEDRVRYDMQMSEKQSYLEAAFRRSQLVTAVQSQLEGVEQNAPPPPELPKPPMPDWMTSPEDEPDPVRTVPVRAFSHGVCIESIAGNLGIGFGTIQADFNVGANTAMNQFIDAATLNNAKGFIATSAVKFDRPFSYSPGMINVVSNIAGGDLQKHLFPLEVGKANPQLIDVVDRLHSWGQESIQSPSVMSGESGKSGETFRGLMARIDQATKQLSVSTRKYSEFLKQILKNNSRLNAKFLPEKQILFINNHRLGSRQIEVGRELYRRGYRVTIRADLKYSSDAQRIADAIELASNVAQHPWLKGNPLVNYLALREVFEAMDKPELVQALGSPPGPTDFVRAGMMGGAILPQQQPGQARPGASGPSGPAPAGGT